VQLNHIYNYVYDYNAFTYLRTGATDFARLLESDQILIKAAALLVDVVHGSVTAVGVASVLALSVVQQSTW